METSPLHPALPFPSLSPHEASALPPGKAIEIEYRGARHWVAHQKISDRASWVPLNDGTQALVHGMGTRKRMSGVLGEVA